MSKEYCVIILGFILGIVSAVFFAFYMVPQKVLKLSTTTYLWWVGLGMLGTSLLPWIAVGCPHRGDWRQHLLAMLCGMVWAVGTMCFSAGIHRIGLALATPFKNTTGVFGTLVGLYFLQEWKTTNPWLCLAGSMLVVLSALLIGAAGNGDVPKRANLLGIVGALGAALCYASYIAVLKGVVEAVGYWEFAPWMGIGITATAGLGVLLRPGGLHDARTVTARQGMIALLGGVSWILALYALVISMHLVDLSVAWALAQLNTIPAVILGIAVFREVRFRANWLKITAGLLAATVGTVLLGLSK
jgi:glucose uptake protein GlcU